MRFFKVVVEVSSGKTGANAHFPAKLAELKVPVVLQPFLKDVKCATSIVGVGAGREKVVDE